MDLTSKDITNVKENVKNKKVAVIGDFIIDEYVFGDAYGLCREAPIVKMIKGESELRPGGGGNVAANFFTLGVETYLYSILSFSNNDVRNLTKKYPLDGINIKPSIYLRANMPQITRFVDGDGSSGKYIFRIDSNFKYSERAIIFFNNFFYCDNGIKETICDYDAIYLADYDKGLINEKIAKYIISLIKKTNVNKKPIIFVDTKKKDISCFYGADILKLNYKETKELSLDCQNFVHEFKYFVQTLGKNGCELIQKINKDSDTELIHIQPFIDSNNNFYCTVGCGDSHGAAIIVGLLGGLNMIKSLEFANVVAAQTIKKLGVNSINISDIIKILENVEKKEKTYSAN